MQVSQYKYGKELVMHVKYIKIYNRWGSLWFAGDEKMIEKSGDMGREAGWWYMQESRMHLAI